MVKSLQKEVTQDFQDFTYNTYNGKITEKQVEVSFKFIYIAKVLNSFILLKQANMLANGILLVYEAALMKQGHT